MKRIIALLALLLLVGCQSFESNTLKTLELSRIAVTAATEAYGSNCLLNPCKADDIIRAEAAFNTWKEWSLTTAEALRAYMMVKAQVGANLAPAASEVVAKAKVQNSLNSTVAAGTTINPIKP